MEGRRRRDTVKVAAAEAGDDDNDDNAASDVHDLGFSMAGIADESMMRKGDRFALDVDGFGKHDAGCRRERPHAGFLLDASVSEELVDDVWQGRDGKRIQQEKDGKTPSSGRWCELW
ncbi:hypothetical protein CDD80_1347 [Ophiocordyceps camponoti-rufipedis]|uniref:Uncharacterized protein n=1 Tax=Ophiocordyceps camponoti-rufipedis TaxID=2004952 RepID=A0A2C5XM99_9HYPO|nr:hypothetical protein CDD80_1347 [Ophiocordyceps camponoti-rufipedis]